MTQPQPPARPWYCNGRLVDDYKTVLATGGDLRMLKLVKILRSIVVNAGIIAITLYALRNGGDPTIVGPMGLGVLAAYNGIEIADYQALARAVLELSSEREQRDDGGDDT